MKRSLWFLAVSASVLMSSCLTWRPELRSDHPLPNRYYLQDAYYRGEPTPGKIPVKTVIVCESSVRLPADVTVTRRCP